ncbi:MAG: hypothetical protein ACE5EA_02010 [Nitrospirota bacterium]
MNKMLKTDWTIYLFVTALFIIGCGTVVNGRTQKIIINSSPSGDRIVVNGFSQKQAPAIIPFNRGNSRTIIYFEKKGYGPVEMVLRHTTDGWIWGNIIIGDPLGVVIDFINGEAHKLNHDQLNAVLQKQGIKIKDIPKDEIIIAVDSNFPGVPKYSSKGISAIKSKK